VANIDSTEYNLMVKLWGPELYKQIQNETCLLGKSIMTKKTKLYCTILSSKGYVCPVI